MKEYDVLVIGGGPAGLAAAIAADKEGAQTVLIEREERLGGILKQCIHDGFGLVRFGEMLTGPEYAERFIEEFMERRIDCRIQAFVTRIQKEDQGFTVSIADRTGMKRIRTRTVVLATGCRERTARQVFIHGTRPAGIFTAGTAQHFVNLLGEMVTKRCVILGSGDIGLIMARRLTLEGARVLGVYEVKPEPSGLTSNIRQCLEDYQIPLFLSHTVTRVFGQERLEAVEVARVDDDRKPIAGTEERISCDALILSVGLIPENEIAQQLGIPLDRASGGPLCDNSLMTDVEGVFTCGNAMNVNDLVDYVSESGERAGKNAARYTRKNRTYVELKVDSSLLCLVPQRVEEASEEPVVLYFRSSTGMDSAVLEIQEEGRVLFRKKYADLKPPEMERLSLDWKNLQRTGGKQLLFSLKGGGG